MRRSRLSVKIMEALRFICSERSTRKYRSGYSASVAGRVVGDRVLITRNSCSSSTSRGSRAWGAAGRLGRVAGRSGGPIVSPPRPGVLLWSWEGWRGWRCWTLAVGSPPRL